MPPSTSICVNWHVKLICVKWHSFQSASNAMHKKCVKCHAKSDLRQKPPCVKFLCVKGPCVKSYPICLSNKVPASKFRGTKAICVKRPSPISLAVFAQNNQFINRQSCIIPIGCKCYIYWNIIYVISIQIKLYVTSMIIWGVIW